MANALQVYRAMAGAPLTMGARAVLVEIVMDAHGTVGVCTASSHDLGLAVGLCQRAVEYALTELRKLGAIECKGTKKREIRVLPDAVARRFHPAESPHRSPHPRAGIPGSDPRTDPRTLVRGPLPKTSEPESSSREDEPMNDSDNPTPYRVTGTKPSTDPLDEQQLAELFQLQRDADPERNHDRASVSRLLLDRCRRDGWTYPALRELWSESHAWFTRRPPSWFGIFQDWTAEKRERVLDRCREPVVVDRSAYRKAAMAAEEAAIAKLTARGQLRKAAK